MKQTNMAALVSKPSGRQCLISCIILCIVLIFEYIISKQSNTTKAYSYRLHKIFVIECGVGIGSYYVWHSFIKVTGLRDSKLVKLFLFSFLFLAHMSYFAGFFLPSGESQWITLLCYTSLGIELQMMTGRFFAGCFSWLFSFMQKIEHFPTTSDKDKEKVVRKQRSLFKAKQRRLALFAIFYTLIMCIVGFSSVRGLPKVKRVDLTIPSLPPSFDGYEILMISDIHIGPTVGQSRVDDLVQLLNMVDKDAVFIVGDLVDGTVASLGDTVRAFRRVKAKDGIYFVTGNHEYYTTEADAWLEFVRSLGITVLHNSNHVLRREGDQLCVAGVDDSEADYIGYTGHGFDVHAALRGCSPDIMTILLCHKPSGAKTVMDPSFKNVPLVLSGHTHGGQFFPFNFFAWLFNPYLTGLYHVAKEKMVYVSQGTFFWGVPMRIGTSMEVSKITLWKYGG